MSQDCVTVLQPGDRVRLYFKIIIIIIIKGKDGEFYICIFHHNKHKSNPKSLYRYILRINVILPIYAILGAGESFFRNMLFPGHSGACL